MRYDKQYVKPYDFSIFIDNNILGKVWYVFYNPEYRLKINNLRKIKSKTDISNKEVSIEKANLKHNRRILEKP